MEIIEGETAQRCRQERDAAGGQDDTEDPECHSEHDEPWAFLRLLRSCGSSLLLRLKSSLGFRRNLRRRGRVGDSRRRRRRRRRITTGRLFAVPTRTTPLCDKHMVEPFERRSEGRSPVSVGFENDALNLGVDVPAVDGRDGRVEVGADEAAIEGDEDFDVVLRVRDEPRGAVGELVARVAAQRRARQSSVRVHRVEEPRQTPRARLDDARRDARPHARRGRAGARVELRHVARRQLERVDELDRLVEVGFGLAREAADDVRHDRRHRRQGGGVLRVAALMVVVVRG
mmetsp:Transcript_14578/g.58223  ORF Transcript_14578/g.58223 Transcript_14578/m.58223 type:complete len:287 (-) Transcript_14578:215-1075(-)